MARRDEVVVDVHPSGSVTDMTARALCRAGRCIRQVDHPDRVAGLRVLPPRLSLFRGEVGVLPGLGRPVARLARKPLGEVDHGVRYRALGIYGGVTDQADHRLTRLLVAEEMLEVPAHLQGPFFIQDLVRPVVRVEEAPGRGLAILDEDIALGGAGRSDGTVTAPGGAGVASDPPQLGR